MASATIRVQFGSAESSAAAHLSAEIDSRADGLNGGVTAFSPGDRVYCLLYKSDNVSISEVICSAGSFTAQGSEVISLTEELAFEDSDTASLRRPARDDLAQTAWYGRDLGQLRLQADHMTLKAATAGVAVVKVTYDALALVYELASPATLNGEDDFNILVLVKGAVT